MDAKVAMQNYQNYVRQNIDLKPELGVENYNNIIKVMFEGAKLVCPKFPITHRRKPWIDNSVQQLREKVMSTQSSYRKCPFSKELKQNYKTLLFQLKELYTNKENSHRILLCQDILSASRECRYKKAWNLLSQLTGRKDIQRDIIPANDAIDRVSKFQLHFKRLLASDIPPVRSNLGLGKVINDLCFVTGPFSTNELKAAQEKLKVNRSPDKQGMISEIIKNGEVDSILLNLLNTCYATKSVPSDWHVSIIIPVFKKGDPKKCDNYRGIAIEDILAKLYNVLLSNRLMPTLVPILRPNQNGFLPLRCGAQHVLTLRRIIEEIQTSKQGLAIFTFIDFKKAFDSPHWNWIENILLAYDVPKELVDAIMSMYYGAKASVKVDGIMSEMMELCVGVLQGDTLAPFLFVLVLDWILRNAIPEEDKSLGFHYQKNLNPLNNSSVSSCTRSKASPCNADKYVTDLDFADDIAMLNGSMDNSLSGNTIISNANFMFQKIKFWATKIGLNINFDKTKYLLIGNWNEFRSKGILKFNNGIQDSYLEEVEDFKYLGSWLISSKKDFEVHKGIAWEQVTKLNHIWRSSVFSYNVKFLYFQALIETVLIFNAVTWTVDKSMNDHIEGTYNLLLRYALNIKWNEHVSNVEIFSKLPGYSPISDRLRVLRLAFAGHCFRSPQSAPQPISDFLFWNIPGYSSNGKNYYDLLLSDCNALGKNWKRLKDLMSYRLSWSNIIHSEQNKLKPRKRSYFSTLEKVVKK